MELPVVIGLERPEDRLQYAYENCKENQYVEGHYAKYEKGKLSVCGIGWALKASGWTDEELGAKRQNLACFVNSITNNKDPTKALSEYGFSREEGKKVRYCPLPDCTHFGGLQHVLEHINECHRIPIPNIGKMIPSILNSKKPRRTIADHFVMLKKDIKELILAK